MLEEGKDDDGMREGKERWQRSRLYATLRGVEGGRRTEGAAGEKRSRAGHDCFLIDSYKGRGTASEIRLT